MPARPRRSPWGQWEVLLAAPGYLVKRITVVPGKRLSYQTHAKREEHWTVVDGRGLATLEGREVPMEPGDTLSVAVGAAHRMANRGSGNLIFIEISLGDYLGEDDILRLEDDFGRAKPR